MTSPTRVLLNKNFSVTAAQMTALMGAQAAAGDADAPYELWASHSDPANGMLAAASHTLLEPAGLLGDAYADWLLDACVQRGIGVLWAGKEREWLADHQGRFAAQGVQLVVPAERHIQEKLDHKDAFLEDWDRRFCRFHVGSGSRPRRNSGRRMRRFRAAGGGCASSLRRASTPAVSAFWKTRPAWTGSWVAASTP
ncbi:hypothetical protein [Deinococcus radiophilus]|uniref:hypothetical protein n=1 Tax=Deinococcus radiophilus TaxID=32062 RepID=UPI00360C1F9F